MQFGLRGARRYDLHLIFLMPGDWGELQSKYGGEKVPKLVRGPYGLIGRMLVLLPLLMMSAGAYAQYKASSAIVRVPNGIHCETLRCAEAFIDAFARGERVGWRLYAIEMGRRRAEAKLPALAILSSSIFNLYVEDYMFVQRGELELIKKKTRNGATYFKVQNNFSEDHSLYVVPTKSAPPRALRRQ